MLKSASKASRRMSQHGSRLSLMHVPAGDSKGTVDVRIWLSVFDLFDVNLPAHMFTIDFFLEASWEDEHAHAMSAESMQRDARSTCAHLASWEEQFPYSQPEGEARLWTPRLSFDNSIELKNKEAWYKVFTKTRFSDEPLLQPVVCYRLHAKGVFRERFELQSFPFDSQDLQVVIISRHPCVRDAAHGDFGRAVRLSKNLSPHYNSVVPHKDFLLSDQYHMAPKLGDIESKTDVLRSCSRKQYPKLTLAIKISRNPSFYVYSVGLPMFLFVLLGFPVFLLEPTALDSRLTILYTLLLTSVAYKFWISEQLPRCSYLTLTDRYILLCIVMLVLMAAESSLLQLAVSFGVVGRSIHVLENVSAIVFMICWCAVHWEVLAVMRTKWTRLPSKLEKDGSNAIDYYSDRIFALASECLDKKQNQKRKDSNIAADTIGMKVAERTSKRAKLWSMLSTFVGYRHSFDVALGHWLLGKDVNIDTFNNMGTQQRNRQFRRGSTGSVPQNILHQTVSNKTPEAMTARNRAVVSSGDAPPPPPEAVSPLRCRKKRSGTDLSVLTQQSSDPFERNLPTLVGLQLSPSESPKKQ